MPTKLDERIIAARQARILAWNQQWTQQQLRRGVDGPTPDDRKKVSDYNQHVPIMESSGTAQDLYFARAMAIQKMGAKELGLEPQPDDDEEVESDTAPDEKE